MRVDNKFCLSWFNICYLICILWMKKIVKKVKGKKKDLDKVFFCGL